MKWFHILWASWKKIKPGLIGMGIVMFLFGLSMADAPVPQADVFKQETLNQNKVMAFYLYNFLLFVEWPEGTFEKEERLHVRILGNDALLDALRPMNGKSIGGKILTVTKLEDLYKEEKCHALFIDSSKKPMAPHFLEQVRDRPVLTISNIQDFVNMGGMIVLQNVPNPPFEKGEPKRFKVNIAAVERAGLEIGARLLRLSHIVRINGHR